MWIYPIFTMVSGLEETLLSQYFLWNVLHFKNLVTGFQFVWNKQLGSQLGKSACFNVHYFGFLY